MRKPVCIIFLLSFIIVFMTSCSTQTYDQGYRAGFNDGYEYGIMSAVNAPDTSANNAPASALPLIIIDDDMYELSLIDAYQSEEKYVDPWSEEENSEQCYVFKFRFLNKYEKSNIRIALVDASINGYCLSGVSDSHSDDSFTVYTWSGNNPDNASVDCFKLFFSDIESATNIRDAEKMGNASLSFVFRVYVVEEMDDYGEDVLLTIENAFQYCK